MESWIGGLLEPGRLAAGWMLLLALTADAMLGDPRWLYDRVRHPVVLIGAAIGWLDGFLNVEGHGAGARRLLGLAGLLGLLGLIGAVAWSLQAGLATLSGGWLVEALLASTLLAQKSLRTHVAAVADGLDTGGVPGGRRAVAMIVGRDPDSLDGAGVARAAIESAAEGFSDGVVAPAFWYLVGGLPGLLLYKAVNTADSMIGHRTPRHEAFGWAAARLDDLMNLVPARLAGLMILLAGLVLPWDGRWPRPDDRGPDDRGPDDPEPDDNPFRGNPGRVRAGWRAMWRDAGRHKSPNAGWQEAPLAGVLGLALAGPRRYGNRVVEDGWMNPDGRADAGADDIRRALMLLLIANGALWDLTLIVALSDWI